MRMRYYQLSQLLIMVDKKKIIEMSKKLKRLKNI